jgi:hypothetical protein
VKGGLQPSGRRKQKRKSIESIASIASIALKGARRVD